MGAQVALQGDMPVETFFPKGRERLELGSSGWSRVFGINAVGGPPHGYVADEGAARVDSRRRTDWLGVSLEGVVLDLVDEVYDQLGSLCQAGPHTRSAWRLVECLGARAADLGR